MKNEKTEVAVSELQLLYDATPEHNTLQKSKLQKVIDLLIEKEINDQEADTHEEATKGLSTRLKANTPAVEKESLMYLPYVKIWEEENIIEASIKFKKEDFESFSDLTLNQVFGKFTLIKND